MRASVVLATVVGPLTAWALGANDISTMDRVPIGILAALGALTRGESLSETVGSRL